MQLTPGSCCEIDQEMDAILLIIDIVYGVCQIVIKSIQQCTYFLFSVNLHLVGVNYDRLVISLQANNLTTGPCHYPGKYTINVYMFIH
jgi:hypothetical protein